ncbi:MAG: kinase-like protein [Hyperionvirus sp.]|uniref:non-specific serine/threonine protein kinase n=1 Tax=Hyperionvirus sp. TaxID=2487770 RepID=A0A3G5AB09_9VIRU|nr:MAG: kinase-like protein [Hyperionvirus sp.]
MAFGFIHEVCPYLLEYPRAASGCIDEKCGFAHTEREYRGGKGMFEDMFRRKVELFKFTYEDFGRWLELRNDNRKKVTKFVSEGDLDSFREVPFFASVLGEQGRILRRRIIGMRERVYEERRGVIEEKKRKVVEKKRMEEEMRREEEVRLMMGVEEEDRIRVAFEAERVRVRRARERRLVANKGVMELNEVRRVKNEVRRVEEYERERRRLVEKEGEKYLERIRKRRDIENKKGDILEEIGFMDQEIRDAEIDVKRLDEKVKALREGIREKEGLRGELKLNCVKCDRDLEIFDEKEIEEENVGFDVSCLDDWCEKLMKKKGVGEIICAWVVDAKIVISLPSITSRYAGVGAYGSVYRVEREGGIVLAEKCTTSYVAELEKEYKNRLMLGGEVLEGVVTHIGYVYAKIYMRFYKYNLLELGRKLGVMEKMKLMPYVLKQLVVGLKYIQEKEHFHNDIKPGNILVNYDLKDLSTLEVVLGDLGSMALRGKDAPRTRLYEAPEQMTGNFTSSRSDVYALGSSVLEFVVGDYQMGRYRNNMDNLPKDFALRSLILKMVDVNLGNRPYVGDILESLVRMKY